MVSSKKIMSGLLLVFAFLASIVISVQAATSSQTTMVKQFSDVSSQERNVEYIQYISQRGLMSGYPDGTFHPGQGLTRAEAAALLTKTAGLKTVDTKVPFKDLPSTHWAQPSIAAATAAGFLSGYPDGTFRPEQKITRAEGISLFLRLSKQKSNATLPVLSDLDAKHWAASQVAEGLAAGMIGLTADNKQFLPNAPLLRSDLARALGVLLTSDPNLYKASMNGELKALSGLVTVTRNGISKEVKADNVYTISQGDIIITTSGGKAELSFPDGSGILINEKTSLTVKELGGRAYIKTGGIPGVAVDWLLLDLKAGTMYGALASSHEGETEETKVLTSQKVTKAAYRLASLGDSRELIAAAAANSNQDMPWYEVSKTKKVKVKVDMPSGIAAVRGSFWENSVLPNGICYTNLLTGDVEVSSGGKTVALEAGQSTTVTAANVTPTQAIAMTVKEIQAWVENKIWVATRAVVIENQRNMEPTPPPPAESKEKPSVKLNVQVLQQQLQQLQQKIEKLQQMQLTPQQIEQEIQRSTPQSVLNIVQAAITAGQVNAGVIAAGNTNTTAKENTSSGGNSSSGGTSSVVVSAFSSNISLYLFETYKLEQNISNISGATLTFTSSNDNAVIEEVPGYGIFVRGNVAGGTATITVTASQTGYTSSSATFTVTVLNDALANNEDTIIQALANSAVTGIRLAPKVYNFTSALTDPGRAVNIYCSAGETAIIMLTGRKPSSITIGIGVTLYEDNASSNTNVSLIPIGYKTPGQEVIMAGTTMLAEVLIKVIRPDNTILYVDVAKTANLNFSKTITLPADAPAGLYTVVAGQGSNVAIRTFYVETIAQ